MSWKKGRRYTSEPLDPRSFLIIKSVLLPGLVGVIICQNKVSRDFILDNKYSVWYF